MSTPHKPTLIFSEDTQENAANKLDVKDECDNEDDIPLYASALVLDFIINIIVCVKAFFCGVK